jgi:hypothetical protein
MSNPRILSAPTDALASPTAAAAHHQAVADLAAAATRPDFTQEIEDTLYARIPAASDRLWASPVKTWADVVARAELAVYWLEEDLWNGFKSLQEPGTPAECTAYDDKAIVALIDAVFTMAKGGVNV